MHLAASEGHAHIVKFLLSCNVDHTIKDRWGRTPLDDARHFKHPSCISLLLRATNRPPRRKSTSISQQNPPIINETASSTSDDDAGGVMMLENKNELSEEKDLSNELLAKTSLNNMDQVQFY